MSFRSLASMGGGYQQGQQQNQKTGQEIKAEIFKMMIKKKIDAQTMKDQMIAYKDLVSSGQFEVSMGPSGYTFSPISPAERVKNLEAQELLGQGGYGGQTSQTTSQAQTTPQAGNLAAMLMRAQGPGQPQRPTSQPRPMMQPQGQPSMMRPQGQPNMFGGGILGAKARTKAMEQQAEGKIKAKAEILKLSEKARANFGRSVSLFQQITAQLKGKAEEQQGLGLWPGIKGAIATKTKRPGYGRTAAFLGQQRETAIGLNSILTGQNRVIRSVVRMIQETLPDEYDPQDIAASKMAQSIKNAYKLVKSFEKAGLSPGVLRKMNPSELNQIEAGSLVGLYTLLPEEEKEVERIIQDVLQTPVVQKRFLPGLGVQSQDAEYNRYLRTIGGR